MLNALDAMEAAAKGRTDAEARAGLERAGEIIATLEGKAGAGATVRSTDGIGGAAGWAEAIGAAQRRVAELKRSGKSSRTPGAPPAGEPFNQPYADDDGNLYDTDGTMLAVWDGETYSTAHWMSEDGNKWENPGSPDAAELPDRLRLAAGPRNGEEVNPNLP